MKVCFINPPFKAEYGKFSRESRSPSIGHSGVLYYPLWLIYAACVAEKNGFEVAFIDAPAKQMNKEQTLERVKKEASDAKLFVFDTSTPSIYSDRSPGTASLNAAKRSAPEAFGDTFRSHFLPITNAVIISPAPIKSPGTIPALNRLVIDASAMEPYTTNVIDGGITTPIAPPAAINAQENAAGYPAFTIAGIMISPSAATVAGPDPEIAAKKQDTTIHTIAIPPLM